MMIIIVAVFQHVSSHICHTGYIGVGPIQQLVIQVIIGVDGGDGGDVVDISKSQLYGQIQLPELYLYVIIYIAT